MSVEEILQTLQGIDPRSIFTSLLTPYSKYSSSNYAASEQETPSIRVIVSQRKEQISAINTVIERMETLLDQFRKKREQIVSSMKMHEGLVSCIRRLPSDVLKDIFVRCLPPGRSLDGSPNVDSAPLLLTRICRDWREIALDTGRLWSSLYVIKPGQSQEMFFFNWHNWLERAKRCQLSLRIHLNSIWGPSNSDHGWKDAVLKFFQAYTSRLTCLSIDFHQSEADRLDQFLGDVPVLESLSLCGTTIANTPEHKISIIQPYPRLRTLIIDTYSFEIRMLPNINLGWTNLTHLTLIVKGQPKNYAGHHTFATLLATCPNLEHFALCPVRFFRSGNPISLTHAKLNVLEIATDLPSEDQGLYADYMLRLMLPNLSRLAVHQNITFEDVSLRGRDFLDGSQNRVFSVTCTTWLVPCLFAFVNPGWTGLTHIRLKGPGTTFSLFRLLQLGPNLEDIVFDFMDVYSFHTSLAPLTHPTLRSLGLVIRSGSVSILLQRLTFPTLSHLDLTLPLTDDDECWPHSEFKEFLFRSQCPLEILKIKRPCISDEEREEFHTLLPTLKHLELCHSVRVEFLDSRILFREC